MWSRLGGSKAFSPSVMEAPLQAESRASLEPPSCGLRPGSSYLHGSQLTPSESGSSTSAFDSTVCLDPEEEECLVDSQPMCFKENPFLVANRRGKALPPGEQILSGPPVGYGRQGQLQPWLFSKAPSSDYTRTDSPIREAPYSPSFQPANIHFSPNAKDSPPSSTRPGAIQPVGRVRPGASPSTPDGHSQNPFQHDPSPFNSQTSDQYGVRNNLHPKQPSPESPSPGDKHTPEQRSFRDRQKYFEIDVKQQTPDKPKPRVSLVGEDDLKKMREEEERRFEQRAREYLLDEEEDEDEEEDLAKQVAQMKATGKVLLDGVEYKVEPVSPPPQHGSTAANYSFTPPSHHGGGSGFSSFDSKGDSERNSLVDSFQRPNSMTGLIPVYPGESSAPVRTAKAERRQHERLRMQSPELAVAPDKDLSPAEKRALEAEKRAMWRAARMKSLEQDALKAQMVIAKSRDSKKRGALDQLTESPSPAPTPSPTPMEELNPRGLTSPGRLSPEMTENIQYIDSSGGPGNNANPEVEAPPPLPATSALEEMALYSNKRKLRQGRRSLETAVPT